MKDMEKNKELANKEYWNECWGTISKKSLNEPPKFDRYKESILLLLKKLLGEEKCDVLVESYSEYHFWRICTKHLPKNEGMKILEVGSAPGDCLVQFHQMFGYMFPTGLSIP